MKKHLLTKLLAIAVLLTTSWSLFGATSPAANDGKWYYIKSQRGPSAADRWWTVSTEGFVTPAAMQATDAQKFTLVTSSEGKVTFKNKGTESAMTYDTEDNRKHMKFEGNTPVSGGWTLTSNVVGGVQGWAFPGEISGVHQSNGPNSPDYYRIVGGWYDLTDYCTFFFYEATEDIHLQLKIEEAETLSNTAAIGAAPGSYPASAKTTLLNAIDAAKASLGQPEATANTAADALNTAILDFQTTKISLAGSTPVADDGKWYYIRSQRTNKQGAFWTLTENVSGAPSTGFWAIPNVFNKEDNQKFTLVTSTSGKVRFKSFDGKEMKGSGEFVSSDFTNNGWTLTSQVYNSENKTVLKGMQAWSFPGENSGIHQNTGAGYTVRANYYNISDNSTFYFFEAREDIDLQLKIEEASISTASATIGTRPGSSPQEAIDALGAAIVTAKETLESTDATAITNAVTALTEAIATFSASKITPVNASTAAAPIWYLIKSGNPASPYAGSGIYTVGATDQCKWGDTGQLNANLLWRFEKHATGETYKIINAAYPEGDLSSANYGAAGTYWNFQIYPEETRGFQYKIYSGGTTLHTDQSKALVSWANSDGYDGSSAWMFEEVDLVASLTQSITAAKAAQAVAVVGEKAGQFPQAAKDDYTTAITAVETWMGENPTPAPADLFTKMQELAAATTAFNEAKIAPFEVIIPSGKYLIQTLDGKFITTASAEDRKPAATTSGYGEDCLWDVTQRGEINSYGITFGGEAADYTDCTFFLDEKLRWRDTRVGEGSAYALNIWTEQKIYADQSSFTAETIFSIYAPAPGGGYHVYDSETAKFTSTPSSTPVFNVRLVKHEDLLKASLTDSIVAAKAIHAAAEVGEKTGQYTQASKDTYMSAITAIETWVKETESPVSTEIIAKTETLSAATVTFANAKIAPFEIAITSGKFYIQTLDGKYITTTGAADSVAVSVADTESSACIWDITQRGEANAYGITFGGTAANFTDCTFFLDEMFRWRDTGVTTSAYELNEASAQKIYADQATITTETKFTIFSSYEGGGYHVYNSESGKFDANSTTPIFNIRLANYIVDGLNETSNTIRAIVVNNAIVVTDAESVEVYTMTGMKVQNKNLKAGVYVAKANGMTYKVTVK